MTDAPEGGAEPVTRPLAWGVIGATSYVATRAVLPALAASPGSVLAAVASRNPGAARELAVRFGAARSYDGYQAVLDDPEVEAVYLPLPNGLHHEWTLRAAAAGKHVLCEKPLAPDAPTARDMALACKQAGVVLMEAYMTPFHPRSVALDRLLTADGLGAYRSGWASFTFRLQAPDNHRWRPEMGGGALADVGVYCLEPLLRAAGRLPMDVTATAVMTPSGVDASFSGWLDFGRGATGSFFVSFEGPERQQLELVGTVSAASVTDAFASGAAGTRVTLRADHGRARALEGPDGDPYRAMVEHFAAVVRGDAKMQRGPARSIDVIEVADRLRAAAGRRGAAMTAKEDPGPSGWGTASRRAQESVLQADFRARPPVRPSPRAQEPVEPTDLGARPTARRIPVADGVALNVVVRSGDARVPVLLVHGLASNARTWEQVAVRLASLGHPVATVDQRGHGRSDKPDHGYDFATLCADLVAVLDALAWERAVVVGQSTGGNIALELATRRPDRVRAVVGVDGGLIELVERWPAWAACARDLAPPRIGGTPAAEVESWLRSSHPDWSDVAVASTMANFEVRADATVRPWLTLDRHLAILRSLWEHRPSAQLAGLAVPALFVLADTGDEWAATKRVEADRAVTLNPAIRVEWFSPADHDLHVARPEEVAGLIHGFDLPAPD